MAPRKQAGPAKSLSPIIIPLAVIGMGAAAYFGYPAMAAIWLGVVLIAWTEPPVILTGKSKTSAYPVAATPSEASAYRLFRFWSDLKYKMILPNADWFPGWPVLGSFFGAALAAFGAYWIPVTDPYTGEYGQWINVAAAYITVMELCASRRRNVVDGDVSPGVRIDALVSLARTKLIAFSSLIAVGLAIGSGAAVAGLTYLPLVAEVPDWAVWTFGLTGGVLLAISKLWVTESLSKWREVVETRELWAPRWTMLKMEPAPRLIGHEFVGAAIVDTFEAQGGTSSATFINLGEKIVPTVGAGFKLAVLETPNTTSKGEPIPGTQHPNRFQVVTWPTDGMPDFADPTLAPDVASLALRCAMAWTVDTLGFDRPVFASLDLVTEPAQVEEPNKKKTKQDVASHLEEDPETGTMVTVLDEDPYIDRVQAEPASPAVWVATFHGGTGPGMKIMRLSGKDTLAGKLGSNVAIDHRFNGGEGMVLIGAMGDPSVRYTEESGITEQDVENILVEDRWIVRWTDVLKQKANPPFINHKNYSQAALSDGVVVHRQPFLVAQGISPSDYFGLEEKLATTLSSAPFVYVGAYGTGGNGNRAGERHAGAFAVYWSERPVPNVPQKLAPFSGPAPKYVLSGLLGKAFRASGLDQPEVLSVRALTAVKSPSHVWKVDVRLYGKTTLATVQAAAAKLTLALGVPYLRVAAHADGCTIVAGDELAKVRLATPKDREYLTALDWDYAWLFSRVVNVNGLAPKLSKVGCLPSNEQVQVLDFELPVGLDITKVQSAKTSLTTATGNAFIEVTKIPDEPTMARLLVSRNNPLPKSASYDWDIIDNAKGMPFATGIEGEPVEYNPKDDPHLLVAGSSGSGKSVILQTIIYGTIIRGYDLYIGDPVKGGADFQFAKPYARAVTGDLSETLEMVKGVHTEAVRRQKLNVKYGVGSYRDLPDEVRPPHAVIVLDEFTSMVMGQEPPKASEDPYLEDERNEIIALNLMKEHIGTYVGRIARESRSAGVTIIIATQKMDQDLAKKIGAPDLKNNLAKILAGKTSYGQRASALSEPESAPDLGDDVPAGRSLFESKIAATRVLQGWYEPGEQVTLTEKLAERCEPLDPSEKMLLGEAAAAAKKAAKAVKAAPKVVELAPVEMTIDDFASLMAEEGIVLEQGEPQVEFEAATIEPVEAVQTVPQVKLPDNFWDDEDDEAEEFQPSSETVQLVEPDELELVPVPAPAAVEAVEEVRPVEPPTRSRRSRTDNPFAAEDEDNPFAPRRSRRQAVSDDNPFA